MNIKLIAALGNNDQRYAHTRHNIGFDWIDHLASTYQLTWQTHSQGVVTKLRNADGTIVLFKPNKLMNINGQPIAQCMNFFKITAKETMLVYDDLDLAPGIIKVKKSLGHGGHNGVRSCQVYMDIEQLLRLKIGIGKPLHKSATSSYVLQKPSESEQARLTRSIHTSIKHIPLLFDNKVNQYQEQLAINNKQEDNNGI